MPAGAIGNGMSDDVVTLIDSTAAAPSLRRAGAGSFLSHARAIGFITLISRLLGMARESIAANYFGAGVVWSAFTFAFTIPNLFRKLFGEGALSAAFIPLYAQAVKRQTLAKAAVDPAKQAISQEISPNDFAAASVNLLCATLIALTLVGELILWGISQLEMRWDYLLAIKLTAIMLPYVLLVCGTAFLGGILQVHDRFVATAATAIVLNLCLIVAIVLAARRFDLSSESAQVAGVRWLALSVLIAGAVQVAMLLPSLHAAGFRFGLMFHLWSPAIRRMLLLSAPVALSAGVLQVSVLLDKAISFFLAQGAGETHFSLLGLSIRYPMAEGAAARLNWAQFMYQFPLGVFAIALATAIFPRLSSDAFHGGTARTSRTVPDAFKQVLRRGFEATMFIGLPASVGMIVVRYPAVRLLFERGEFTSDDTRWVALSTAIYSSAIWAFSLLQILNRAYYALHDMLTPLLWGIVNLMMNLVVELPLLWTGLGESALPVGTLVSFSVQAVAMLWMIDRRIGGIGLKSVSVPIVKMLVATLIMWLACMCVQYVPGYPAGTGKAASAVQLLILITVGGASYFLACAAMGLSSPMLRAQAGREAR